MISYLVLTPLIPYFAYPAILKLVTANVRQNSAIRITKSWPKVEIVTTMHNAELVICEKIFNTSKLEYPGEMEAVFLLDGCTDATLYHLEQAGGKIGQCKVTIKSFDRAGKENAIRNHLKDVSADILIFTDADSMVSSDAIFLLVEKLLDPKVGAVCGNEIHAKKGDTNASQGQGKFYEFEERIKKQLEVLGLSLPYVQGGFFALKVSNYPATIHPGETQDGAIAFQCMRNGLRVAYCEDAVSSEDYQLDSSRDFVRRRRTISRAFFSVLKNLDVLNPLQNPGNFVSVFFGRILRWLSPFLFIAGLASIIVDPEKGYGDYLLLFLIGLFALFSLDGWIRDYFKLRRGKTYYFYYFSYIHVAAMLAVFDVVRGKRHTMWAPSAK